MLVAILHNAVADDAPADERDVLVQVEAVAASLARLGHTPTTVPVTLNLEALANRLSELKPNVAFNLVEALGGTDRLSPAVPTLLDTLGLPYTGGGADAFYVTCSKALTKAVLGPAQIPVPAAPFREGEHTGTSGNTHGTSYPARFLVKAVHEHASFGMTDDSVLDVASPADLAAVSEFVRRRSEKYGKPFFAERFIDGREFNLSVLDRGDGSPEVLPPAEITFDTFPPGKPRIVGYAAKWDEGAFEYHQTPRRFDFPPGDAPLLARLEELAGKVWTTLRLRGYARVDFRVDEAGHPWVIEANANPCLSPDAGFAAALANAGLSFDEAIRRILSAAA